MLPMRVIAAGCGLSEGLTMVVVIKLVMSQALAVPRGDVSARSWEHASTRHSCCAGGSRFALES